MNNIIPLEYALSNTITDDFLGIISRAINLALGPFDSDDILGTARDLVINTSEYISVPHQPMIITREWFLSKETVKYISDRLGLTKVKIVSDIRIQLPISGDNRILFTLQFEEIPSICKVIDNIFEISMNDFKNAPLAPVNYVHIRIPEEASEFFSHNISGINRRYRQLFRAKLKGEDFINFEIHMESTHVLVIEYTLGHHCYKDASLMCPKKSVHDLSKDTCNGFNLDESDKFTSRLIADLMSPSRNNIDVLIGSIILLDGDLPNKDESMLSKSFTVNNIRKRGEEICSETGLTLNDIFRSKMHVMNDRGMFVHSITFKYSSEKRNIAIKMVIKKL